MSIEAFRFNTIILIMFKVKTRKCQTEYCSNILFEPFTTEELISKGEKAKDRLHEISVCDRSDSNTDHLNGWVKYNQNSLKLKQKEKSTGSGIFD